MKVVACIGALLMVAACTSKPPYQPPPTDQLPPLTRTHVSSGLPIEQLFPLVDGHIYNYAKQTTDGRSADGADTALLIANVVRTGELRGELHMSGSTRYFEYASDGLTVLSATTGARTYVLKWPPTLDQQWYGEHRGRVQVTAIDQTVTVRAGSFSGCVTVVEARRGDLPARFETTFCPNVGIVLLQAASGNIEERAELVSYGPPVTIGPDGVRVLE